jgi:hypothetical protein
MSTNVNPIHSSFISNVNPTSNSSVKKTGNDIFAIQLDNIQKTDTYLNEIKSCVPKTEVTVKSMNAIDVQKYYEEWKKQPTDYSRYNHNIIISPKVLERMEKDPKYAEQMLLKIKKAAIPEGFSNATIYEYKVIVRDDGEIETFACADFMNGKNKKADNDDDKKKDTKKQLEPVYLHRNLYDQWKSQTITAEEINIPQFIKSQYLLYPEAIAAIRSENKVIDSKEI